MPGRRPAVIEVIARLVRASQRMRRDAGCGATSAELSEQVDLPLDEVEEAMRVAKGMVLLELPANEQEDEDQPPDDTGWKNSSHVCSTAGVNT